MANIKSAMKRAKLADIRTMRNKSVKTGIKTSMKNFDLALESKDLEAAMDAFKIAVKKLDKGVAKGVLHKNSASRKKSSLARKLNMMQ